ncbi:MAG: helix-turn-helix domain-containing protein [Natronomonas sp.]
MDGIRVELAVGGPAECPVSTIAAEGDGPVEDVTWTRTTDDSATEQFRLLGGANGTADEVDAESVFDIGDDRVYEIERDRSDGTQCVCEILESLDCPINDVRVLPDELVLTLHLSDVSKLRSAVAALEDAAERVEVRYLVRTGTEDADGSDPVVVDRGRLTDRQREVLETAHAMGYFEYPRESNATEVAEELGIGVPTFTEHLAVSQAKLLDEISPEA